MRKAKDVSGTTASAGSPISGEASLLPSCDQIGYQAQEAQQAIATDGAANSPRGSCKLNASGLEGGHSNSCLINQHAQAVAGLSVTLRASVPVPSSESKARSFIRASGTLTLTSNGVDPR